MRIKAECESHGCDDDTEAHLSSRDWVSYALLLLIFVYMKVCMITNSMKLRLKALETMMHDKVRQFEDTFYLLQCILNQTGQLILKMIVAFSEELLGKISSLAVGIKELIRKMAVKFIMGHFKVIQCMSPKSASTLVEEKIEQLLFEKHPIENITSNMQAKLLEMKSRLPANQGHAKYKNFNMAPENLEALSPTASINHYIEEVQHWSLLAFIFVAVVILVFTFLRKKKYTPKKAGDDSIVKKTMRYAAHGPSWLFLLSGIFSLLLSRIESSILKMAALHLAKAVSLGSKEIISALSEDICKLVRLEFANLNTMFEELYNTTKANAIQPMVILSSLQDVLSDAINKHLLPAFNEVFNSGMVSWASNALFPITSILNCISGFDPQDLKGAFFSPLQTISQALIFPMPSMLKELQNFNTPADIENVLLRIIEKSISHEAMVKTAITNDEYLFCLILIFAGLFVIVVQSFCYAIFLLFKKKRSVLPKYGLS
ncbi:hypothetical protein MDAP_000116 [Mitosporidium daphniae]